MLTEVIYSCEAEHGVPRVLTASELTGQHDLCVFLMHAADKIRAGGDPFSRGLAEHVDNLARSAGFVQACTVEAISDRIAALEDSRVERAVDRAIAMDRLSRTGGGR